MNNRKHRITYLFFSVLIVFISCEKPDIIDDSALLNSLYANSLDTIQIDSYKYILETELYRSFTPSGGLPPAKHPLIAQIFLVNIDSISIPDNIDIAKLYVIKDELIWVSNPINSDTQYLPDYKLKKISNDGPFWDPEIYVDVVVEITNNSSQNTYLLIAKEQFILKVW